MMARQGTWQDTARMTRDQVRSLLSRHKHALNRHDISALMSLYTEDAVVTSPMFHTVRGRAAIAEAFQKLFALWPDYHVRVQESLFMQDGDRAAEFGSVMATHSAELFGLPPTGEQIEYEFVRVYTVRDNQIAAERRLYDLVGVLERLGKSQLQRELGVAAAIQRLLLPRTHHSGSYFEAVGASLPSRTIGGDFFEYVDLPSGHFGVALGDASGKGAAAALVAAMVQGIFSIEAEAERSPSATLTRVNRALRRRGMEPHFVTLAYGVLSPDGCFRYSNAGQNPPMLLTDGDVRSLTVGGPMLGLFDDPVFDEETLYLRSRDGIVLVSDGVTEALNEGGEEFLEARLLDVVRHCRRETPDALLDAVLGGVRQFCGGAAQRDDVTSVVVQYR
jgi:steroid delta-isomerase-like uncharacterized protein